MTRMTTQGSQDNQNHNANIAIASLEERVTGIERSVNDIANAVRGLATEFRAGQRPQWAVIVSAAGVITTILGLISGMAYMPIKQHQDRLDLRITRTQHEIDRDMVPRREVELYQRLTEEKHRDRDRRLEVMEGTVLRQLGQPRN